MEKEKERGMERERREGDRGRRRAEPCGRRWRKEQTLSPGIGGG